MWPAAGGSGWGVKAWAVFSFQNTGEWSSKQIWLNQCKCRRHPFKQREMELSCLVAAGLIRSSSCLYISLIVAVDHMYFVSFKVCQSQNQIGQYFTLPSAQIRTLFPHGLPRRYQQQVCAYVCDCVYFLLTGSWIVLCDWIYCFCLNV